MPPRGWRGRPGCWWLPRSYRGLSRGSLSRRSWVDQGVITGFTTGLTYLLTLLTHDGIEVLASRLAPALPLGSDATAALTASAEPFCSRIWPSFPPVSPSSGPLHVGPVNEPSADSLARPPGVQR